MHSSDVLMFLQAYSHNKLKVGSGSRHVKMEQRRAIRVDAKRIIEVFLSSEVMADIVLLFRNNPRLIDNIDRIASRIGRKGESIEADLKKLVELGILNMERSGKQTWFGFDAKRDKHIQKIIENYLCNHK